MKYYGFWTGTVWRTTLAYLSKQQILLFRDWKYKFHLDSKLAKVTFVFIFFPTFLLLFWFGFRDYHWITSPCCITVNIINYTFCTANIFTPVEIQVQNRILNFQWFFGLKRLCLKNWIHSFFINIRVNCVEAQYA